MWADYAYAGADLSKFEGVMRYLPFTGSQRGDLTVSEIAAHHTAGRAVSPVWEKGAGDALGDQAAGVAAAKAANAAADVLGFPAGVPVWFAVDQDLAPAQVVAYFEGIRSVAARPVGIYGSARIVDWAASVGIAWRWQTAAWSGSTVSPFAHLLQARFLSNVDENDLLYPFPAWGPKGTTMAQLATTTYRGVTVDERTAAMLDAANALLPNVPFYPSQGSYSTSVAASGGTHSRGGAVDIMLNVDGTVLSDDDARAIESAMRQVGFAAWYRPALAGVWPRHVHGIAIGCTDLAVEAAMQVTDYAKGRDGLLPRNSAGLAINPDTGTRAYVGVTWETYVPPTPPEEDFMATLSDAEKADLFAAVKAGRDAAIQANARVRGTDPNVDSFQQLQMAADSTNQKLDKIVALLTTIAAKLGA